MSKKIFDEQNIINELKGGSAFFPGKPETPLLDTQEKDGPTPPVIGLESPEKGKEEISPVSERQPAQVSSQDIVDRQSKIDPKKESGIAVSRHHNTVIPPYPDTTIERIRKAVKQLGKEAATHRFTPEEKKLLRDIVYTYGARGTKTSENEITRIALHHLIQDYQENNDTSVLARVLERLNG